MALNELEMESMLGGYSNFCRVWTELHSHGIFMAMPSNDIVTFFALTKDGILKRDLAMGRFIDLTYRSPFIHEINSLLGKPMDFNFKTHKLVEQSIYCRVLWASTVDSLGAIRDRLFDCCYEMGDGYLVSKIVSYLQDHNLMDMNFQTIKRVVDEQISSSGQMILFN